MEIRRFKPQEAGEVRNLILDSFHEFVAPSCKIEGIKEFERFQSIEALTERAKVGHIFVAEEEGVIAGVIAMKDGQICSLFVDKQFHRRGIAKALLNKMELLAIKEGFLKMKIRSSLYAVSFYLAQGYKKSTGITNSKGLTYQPLIKKLYPNKLKNRVLP
jgi:GNAT superfamily N-acetyltransferase